MTEGLFKFNEVILKSKHDELGFKFGYDFAMTPLGNMRKAETVIVGLNQGGCEKAYSYEMQSGNDYFDGDVRHNGNLHNVNKQVQLLHDLLKIGKNEVFAAQFVPFRTKDEKGISKEALEYSRSLWAEWVLPQLPHVRRFLCMGKTAAEEISKLIGAPLTPEVYDSGWGNIKIKRYVARDGKLVVQWPHPGRYQLFSRYDKTKEETAKQSMKKAACLI